MYLDEFRTAIRENTGWERIRAAEALVSHGYADEAAAALRDQAETAPPEERIGVWRTLAQAEPTPEGRRKMTDRIRAVFADTSAPDRTHAVEGMAKLRVEITDAEKSLARSMTTGPSAAAVFPNWLLTLSGDADARKSLAIALRDSDPVTRLRAAFSLSHLDDPLSAGERAALEAAAVAELPDAPYRAWMIGAAWKHPPQTHGRQVLTPLLESCLWSSDAAQRLQAANCVVDGGTPAELPLLSGLKNDSDPKIRRAVANAYLRFDSQQPAALKLHDPR